MISSAEYVPTVQPREPDGVYTSWYLEPVQDLARLELAAGAVIEYRRTNDVHILKWWKS